MRINSVEPQDIPALDDEVLAELLTRARAAAAHAYVPYSDFPVGAAVLSTDGSIHAGCNIENASYGLTICAERAALSSAVSAGHRQIVAVAVSAPKVPLTTPCGACRQVLNEFRPETSDMVIILDDGDSGDAVWLDDLLPQAFGPRNLHPALAGDMSSMSQRDDHGG
jgi:cytidine deaminase